MRIGVTTVLGVALLLAGLYATSFVSYLLFQCLVDVLAVAVAFTLLILAWNTRRFVRNDYLKILGISYGLISLIDLLHTLAYKGMGVFPGSDANLATQLWVAARYLQAFAVCVAPFFIRRQLPDRVLWPAAILAVTVPVVLIFLGYFPACYVEGSGLTRFKVVSEYVICGFFLGACGLLFRRRQAFDRGVLGLIISSLILTVLSELSFTLYVSVYDLANLVGHLLKLTAFGALYFALIDIGFRKPYELIFRDLKESEKALGQTVLERTAKLQESEIRFRTIFENSALGKCVTSIDGILLEVNRTFAEMVGFPVEEVKNKSFNDFTHPEDRDLSWHVAQSLLSGKRTSYRFEKRFVRKDGTTVWAEVTTALYRGSENSPRYFITSVADITGKKLNEEEKAKLQAQLQQSQKMESLGVLAGGIAHDMNNVLGAILTLASGKILTLAPDHPQRRTFQTIAKAADRGGKMVKSLLTFARQGPLEVKELDLNGIIREETGLLERTLLAKIRLETDLAPDLRPIRGDASSLTHALMNLSVNAVDAIPEKGTLTITTRNQGPWVEVQVRDTGTGMTKEVLSKALDPFFTTKPMGKGTGLGLSLVYTAVQAHQGQMEIESEPDRGTVVTLRFPALAPGAEVPAPGPADREQVSVRKSRLLLVDDDELIRSSLQESLAAEGHQVTVVSSGEEALLTLASEPPPEAVILDMNMPGLGGAGTLKILRALYPTLAVILATGRSDQSALDLISGYSSVYLLAKPFDIEELNRRLWQISSENG